MKKCLFWLLMLRVGFSLCAQTKPEVFFFLEPLTGISIDLKDNEHIARMLINEIRTHNCALVETPHGADFILSGTLESCYYADEYDVRGIIDKYGPPAATYSYNTSLYDSEVENVYLFQLTLRNVETYTMILQQNLYYASLDDVLIFFPLLVYNLFSYISDTYAFKLTPGTPPDQQFAEQKPEDWKNKWLYARASFDFPITIYKLKGDGLFANTGVYYGDYDNPVRASPQDNKVVTLPAGTLGIEVQFFNWLSVEPKFQVGWEYINDTDLVSFAAGLDVKVPVKLMRNVLLEPYGAVSFPISTSASLSIFDSFPMVAVGGGLQVGIRGGKSGFFFLDTSYMYYLGDAAGLKNPYGDLFPNPPVIYHQRSVIGLGFGYKHGFINRK